MGECYGSQNNSCKATIALQLIQFFQGGQLQQLRLVWPPGLAFYTKLRLRKKQKREEDTYLP